MIDRKTGHYLIMGFKSIEDWSKIVDMFKYRDRTDKEHWMENYHPRQNREGAALEVKNGKLITYSDFRYYKTLPKYNNLPYHNFQDIIENRIVLIRKDR